MQNRNQLFLSSLAVVGGLLLSGCYTQIYTQGYVERSQDYRRPVPADAPYDTSALAKAGADTLLPSDSAQGSKTVIVNNYYEAEPEYRGYSGLEWDYPVLSFGFYSSRYRSYCDPYWWSGHGYRAGYGGGYYPPAHPGGRGNRGSSGGGGSGGKGAYQSDKRIFAPAPDYPAPDKGRRGESSGGESRPAPKASSSSESSGGSKTGGHGNNGDTYPTLKKGRR